MSVSVHVIDNHRGMPAADVTVRLRQQTADGMTEIGAASTGSDGRTADLAIGPIPPGEFQLIFEVGEYFARLGIHSFHPRISVLFRVDRDSDRLHIPLLVTPYAYTTYRGN